jgi:uncharacterized protein YecE (DUF72 family)
LIDIKIGTGGWAYFEVPGDRLARYSKLFDTVEVNSTFYTYPSLDLVRSWRKRTPIDFEFTVRCHQDLSHKYQLQPIEPSYQVFSHMVKICSTLNAEILHIQTPASLEFTPSKITAIRHFLESINSKKVKIAWEIRSMDTLSTNSAVYELMSNYNIIHCIDISRDEKLAYSNDVLYTRLFGKGVHNIYQYTDMELEEIDRKIIQSGARKAILNFHTVRNYKDAARLKVFRKTGSFPRVTKSLGINSLIEVLSEDARFPTTKMNLIRDQGWKIFDWDENQRRKVSELIEKLPDQKYPSLHDLIQVIMTDSSKKTSF